jgi:hypothetical protein
MQKEAKIEELAKELEEMKTLLAKMGIKKE